MDPNEAELEITKILDRNATLVDFSGKRTFTQEQRRKMIEELLELYDKIATLLDSHLLLVRALGATRRAPSDDDRATAIEKFIENERRAK